MIDWIDCVFVIMIASFFGAFILVLMTFAWTLFEESELGQMIIERIRSRFEDEDE